MEKNLLPENIQTEQKHKIFKNTKLTSCTQIIKLKTSSTFQITRLPCLKKRYKK